MSEFSCLYSRPQEVSVTFGGPASYAREGMRRKLRAAIVSATDGAQERVLAAMRSNPVRKLARAWGESYSVAEGDAMWACVAWLQLDENIGLDVYRPSRGPGSRAVAFWQTVVLFRGHWDYRVLGMFEESDIQVLERAGRVHTALCNDCDVVGGGAVEVDVKALRRAFQSVKNNACYRGAGGRALFDQYVGVLLCAGYVTGDIGLNDTDIEWWAGVRVLRDRLQAVLPGVVEERDCNSDVSVSVGDGRVLRVGICLFAGQQSDGPAVEDVLDVYYPCDIDMRRRYNVQRHVWVTSHFFDVSIGTARSLLEQLAEYMVAEYPGQPYSVVWVSGLSNLTRTEVEVDVLAAYTGPGRPLDWARILLCSD